MTDAPPGDPGLESLDHVIVAVADLPEATRTYARLLGRRPSWVGEHAGAGSRNALFRLENTYLELLAPEGAGAVGDALRAWLDARGEGPLGLAFGTRDAEACRAALAARGLEPGGVEKGLGRDVESGAFREWLRVPLPPDRTRGVLLFGIEHRSPADLLPPAGASGDDAGTIHGLDHAVVRTRDAEAAIALYGEAGLGLRLALDRSFEQWGARLIFFRVGGVTVEIAASLAEGEPGDADADLDVDAGRDRLWGFSWRVRDADAARARLAAEGFDVSEVRTGRKPGTRVLTVRGPTHGVATLLLEPAPGGPTSGRPDAASSA
jgi:catechol 2,3-dioxygenase-like lactoylglutathione lyase family enzyme